MEANVENVFCSKFSIYSNGTFLCLTKYMAMAMLCDYHLEYPFIDRNLILPFWIISFVCGHVMKIQSH